MLNIKYSDESFNSVDKFILYLKDYYKRIYFDTWLVDEIQIVSAYMEKTDELFDEIIETIEDNINKWVFWVILKNNSEFELSKLVIQIRSYSIIVIIQKGKDIYIKSILFT